MLTFISSVHTLLSYSWSRGLLNHDDVIKWNYFPRYYPFVRGIHRSPAKRPVTRNFDVFFDLRLNKRLGKQSWCWWFGTLSCQLLRHCNDIYRTGVAQVSYHAQKATEKFRKSWWVHSPICENNKIINHFIWSVIVFCVCEHTWI